MCFLFSSLQLRGWRGGILALCGLFSSRRIRITLAASPAPAWHLCLSRSSPWVRGQRRALPKLPSSASGDSSIIALLHEPAGCGWGPRTLRAPPHSVTQGTGRQCGPAYQQGCKSSCHQGEWMCCAAVRSKFPFEQHFGLWLDITRTSTAEAFGLVPTKSAVICCCKNCQWSWLAQVKSLDSGCCKSWISAYALFVVCKQIRFWRGISCLPCINICSAWIQNWSTGLGIVK